MVQAASIKSRALNSLVKANIFLLALAFVQVCFAFFGK